MFKKEYKRQVQHFKIWFKCINISGKIISINWELSNVRSIHFDNPAPQILKLCSFNIALLQKKKKNVTNSKTYAFLIASNKWNIMITTELQCPLKIKFLLIFWWGIFQTCMISLRLEKTNWWLIYKTDYFPKPGGKIF